MLLLLLLLLVLLLLLLLLLLLSVLITFDRCEENALSGCCLAHEELTFDFV